MSGQRLPLRPFAASLPAFLLNYPPAMPLAPGVNLGPYQILSAIGAGGMGEVYKARDTRLDRTVAVKVLPPHLAERAEWRQRFEREARAISSLNHPHICALYDVGHQDGIAYLVMEYLEGDTLSARLARGPLPMEQVLRFAVEIADALALAHRQSVFHRDLKPGNIMLTQAGTKLLDFGLAKLGAAPVQGALDELPTQEASLTAKGTILGTFPYMAPEQMEGKDTDSRTDIFAFGAVLYEMATAKKAFEGKSHASIAAAILERDPPPISTLQPLAPPALDRIVKRCLAKDPDDRWQSARDLMFELKEVSLTPGPSPPTPGPRGRPLGPTPKVWIAATALCLLAGVGLALIHFGEKPPEAPSYRFQVPPPAKSSIDTFALSPDGRYLVFTAAAAGKSQLWLRPLDSLEAQALPGADGAQFPFWSPDSRFIAFFAQSKLKKVAVTGGPPLTLCDAVDGRGGSWNRDGVIVFAPIGTGALSRVPAAGGTPAPVTQGDPGGGGAGIHRFPHFLPDGRHFLYLGILGPLQGNGIQLGSFDSRDTRRLLADLSSPAFVPAPGAQNGHLLFIRENSLMALPFDPGRLQPAGEAFPVAQQVGFGMVLNHGLFSASDNGILAYQAGFRSGLGRELAWFDREGKKLGAAVATGNLLGPALSPDEKRVAVQHAEQGGSDLWMHEPARGSATRFTFGPRVSGFPVWSPDGSRIAYAANRKGRHELYQHELYQKVATGAGQEELLLESAANKRPTDWSRDGRLLLYGAVDPKTRWDLWVLPMSGDAGARKPAPYLQTEFDESQGRFSPDGRWVAYVSNESGIQQVYVQPFPASGAKVQISTGGGFEPKWRADGQELFFVTLDRKLMAVTVQASPSGRPSLEPGVPRLLFESQIAVTAATGLTSYYEPSADGRRFLINAREERAGESPVTIVVNWLAALKR